MKIAEQHSLSNQAGDLPTERSKVRLIKDEGHYLQFKLFFFYLGQTWF